MPHCCLPTDTVWLLALASLVCVTVLLCNPGRPQSHDAPAFDSQVPKVQECATTTVLIFLFQQSPDSLTPAPHDVRVSARVFMYVHVCMCDSQMTMSLTGLLRKLKQRELLDH